MNKTLRNRILRIILIAELSSLVICLLVFTFYHLQKLENKSQLFLDTSRADFLVDDSRSLQQKIQQAISSHEFKEIAFSKENIRMRDNKFLRVTLSKPILANTNDPASILGYAYFTFSLAPGIAEGVFAWIMSSLVLLLIIPIIQKYLENQIRVDIETQSAKTLAELATQVAHDIRSPLSAIRMISGAPDLNTAEARDLMESAVIRIDEIAQDLVDTAKNNKNLSLNIEILDISILLNSLVKAKQLEFKNDKNVVIQFRNFNHNCKILANNKELKRIMSNLINNSVEAKYKDTVQIDILVEKIQSNTLISVVDNGAGMSEEKINEVLKGNYTSTKIGNGGLGLGLKHTLKSVQQMGGKVNISSKLSQGTIVKLSFNSI
jgi:signal transduction histidine kinase